MPLKSEHAIILFFGSCWFADFLSRMHTRHATGCTAVALYVAVALLLHPLQVPDSKPRRQSHMWNFKVPTFWGEQCETLCFDSGLISL